MRGLGALLVLAGSGMAWVLHRREATLAMRLGEALLEDLAVLRYHVCVCRDPLPEILGKRLDSGLGAERFWRPLLDRLGAEKSLASCWAEAAEPRILFFFNVGLGIQTHLGTPARQAFKQPTIFSHPMSHNLISGMENGMRI